jgi:peptidoglycan/xylan/chitin deacetylase (PgdA/CDA1 family)
MSKIMIFRNDDVRESLDDSLIAVTNIFTSNNIPITHAVEPANVSNKVVEWILKEKSKFPRLIEITQHGYDHKIKNKIIKGEFGGQRTYEEQYDDISKGKELMNKYFGDLWFEGINFPFGVYNPDTIKAVNNVGYKVLNSYNRSHWTRQLFYKFGHLLNKGYLFNKHISWNLDFYPGTNVFEIDANVSFIKKYHNEETSSDMFSLEELIQNISNYKNNKVISTLLHHRYHCNKEKLELIQKFIDKAEEQNFIFLSSEEVYKQFSSQK